MAGLQPPSIGRTFAGWRRALERRFPERHVYVRSPDGVRGIVLTTGHQLGIVGATGALCGWAVAATLAWGLAALDLHDNGRATLAERLALQRAAALRESRLIAAAEDLARARALRLRLILKAAGVEPTGTGDAGANAASLLTGARPGALADALGVDESLAGRIQSAARAADDARTMTASALILPLGRPTAAAQSSPFGVRRDPFTGRTSFHPGLDFAAPRMTPIYATASGSVTFAGARTGYGSTIEIDNGHGVMTRFAHLASIAVKPGQKVEASTPLGAVGSSGRSTGPHLHYEIWRDGRLQDPARYMRAGDYVRQAG
jgi:murein DD-endopeptidase MepM/ murein hydrolase activator NlpD